MKPRGWNLSSIRLLIVIAINSTNFLILSHGYHSEFDENNLEKFARVFASSQSRYSCYNGTLYMRCVLAHRLKNIVVIMQICITLYIQSDALQSTDGFISQSMTNRKNIHMGWNRFEKSIEYCTLCFKAAGVYRNKRMQCPKAPSVIRLFGSMRLPGRGWHTSATILLSRIQCNDFN